MKKISRVLVMVVVSLMVLSMGGCGGGGTDQDDILLGYIGPLTGEGSPWGTTELNVLKMTIDEVNAQGGILGRQVKLSSYDNRGDNVETTNAARKAIQKDGVKAIIGCNTSSTSLALAGVCDEFGVPHIATVATNSRVTQEEDGTVRPYTFRICPSDPQLGGIIGQYAYRELGMKTCAILYEIGSDYSVGVMENFVGAFEAEGGVIVDKEAYKTGDVDFRSQLMNIKESKPDAIFLPALYKEIGLAANQARSLGIEQTFLGGDSWSVADVFTVATDSIQGSVFVAGMNNDDPALEGFKEKYIELYGEDPTGVGPNAFYAYDSFAILQAAIEKAGTTDSKDIRDALENTEKIKGLTCDITMLKESHNPIRETYVFKVKDKTFEPITTFMLEQ